MSNLRTWLRGLCKRNKNCECVLCRRAQARRKAAKKRTGSNIVGQPRGNVVR